MKETVRNLNRLDHLLRESHSYSISGQSFTAEQLLQLPIGQLRTAIANWQLVSWPAK